MGKFHIRIREFLGSQGRGNVGGALTINKKLVLLGDSAVGKTSLIRRFVLNQFDDAYIATIGSKVTRKEVMIRRGHTKTQLNLLIWDILGREGYAGLHARTFAGVHGAVLVADLTRFETMTSLQRYWLPLLLKVKENVPMVFVSNKRDLAKESKSGHEYLRAVASKFNVDIADDLPEGLSTCLSTSAKTGENVEKVFQSLGHLMLSDKPPSDPIRELYESVVAMGITRDNDKSTMVGALDAILVDFCEEFDDDRLAMCMLRQEVTRAGLDVRNPTKEGLLKVVEYLAEAETEFADPKTAMANRDRRLKWAREAKGR